MQLLQKMVAEQQARRAKVDDVEVARFTTVRAMPDVFAAARARAAELAVDGLSVQGAAQCTGAPGEP